MNPQEQREKLMAFLAKLPVEALDSLSQKQVDIFLGVHEIGAREGLVLAEMGGICEGVRRVLAGEDSPNNLVAFISQDKNIEEDNRPKIPAIAQEIQQKIFDPVLPILKQAGMPVKEGRVPSQPTTDNRQPTTRIQTTPGLAASATPFVKGDREESSVSVPRQDVQVPSQFSVPMEEKHLRVLLRIAAGTNYSEEKLREAFEDLPEGLKRAVSSVDTANAIQEITKKFLLHIDQMAALASETGLVLLGLTHPKDFVKNLESRLRISEARALEIAREISTQILAKVRDALRGLHEAKLAGRKVEPSSPPPVKKLNLLAAQEETTTPSVPSFSHHPASGTPARLRMDEVQTGGPPRAPVVEQSSPRGTTGGDEGRVRTPYSPEAKWNTGVPNSQSPRDNNQKSGEEKLTREEVLHGIEHPKEIVGPTGWRKPVPESATSQKPSAPPRAPTTPTPPSPTTPKAPPPLAGGEEILRPTDTRPNDRVVPVGRASFTKGGTEEEKTDFLEQKLAGPMRLPKTETRYTIDPYREPAE